MDSSNKNDASRSKSCPDCESGFEFLTLREFFTRREFMKAAGVTALAAGAIGMPTAVVRAAEAAGSAADATAGLKAAKGTPETLVKTLYKSLSPEQKKDIAFDWDYIDKDRGLLRTCVSNNWNITKPIISSDFYTQDQQDMVRGIYEGLFSPDWVGRIDKQLQDDGKGYGKSQSIAHVRQSG